LTAILDIHTSPLARYQRDLEQSGFQPDPAQALAVEYLQALYDELLTRRAHWPGGKANALSFQLSPLPERISTSERSRPPNSAMISDAVQLPASTAPWAMGMMAKETPTTERRPVPM
jgi:hypothetical protein